jgi:hypothetical protein
MSGSRTQSPALGMKSKCRCIVIRFRVTDYSPRVPESRGVDVVLVLDIFSFRPREHVVILTRRRIRRDDVKNKVNVFGTSQTMYL